ncbi:MAG: Gmad2 immunoglobulin-like domain-containing protein [Parcubacteria group bacterium]
MKNNKSTKSLIIILVLFLTIILIWFFVKNNKQINNTVSQNNDVVLNETTNNENLDNENQEDMLNYENDEGLSLEAPQENETLSSPVNIEGEATGPWYFEGTFTVKLIDRENAGIIADSYVTALGDWMTEEPVDFSGNIEYEIEEETEALLILESANPSGLPENLMTYSIPVTLSSSN